MVGAFNPVHEDDGIAEDIGFEGIIAHGVMHLNYITQILCDFAGHPDGVKKIDVRFKKPVYPDEEITAGAESGRNTRHRGHRGPGDQGRLPPLSLHAKRPAPPRKEPRMRAACGHTYLGRLLDLRFPIHYHNPVQIILLRGPLAHRIPECIRLGRHRADHAWE